MSRTQSMEAIVLKAHDVGEADRFCILFTRQRGKIAARARGVRKLGSRMGGTLLAPKHVRVQLRESSVGYTITDASLLDEAHKADVASFLHMQQGIELLLNTLHDEEPLSELFDVTTKFLSDPKDSVLPFTLVLLSILGLLPEIQNSYFDHYSEKQKDYVQQSLKRHWKKLPKLTESDKLDFSVCCAELLSQISSRQMNVGSVMQDMGA